MNRILYLMGAIFALIGAGALVGDWFLYSSTSRFVSAAKTSRGTVVDLLYRSGSKSGTYYPRVKFNDESGKEIVFESSSGSNPASYSVGDTVEVLYEPSRPEHAEVNSFFSVWGGVLVFSILGPLFFTIGVGSLCVPIMSARKKAWLQVNGQPITTELQRVGTDRSLKVNGRSPYRIYSQWKNPGTGQVHVFKSEAIWFDPAPFATQKSIRVLIARDNPKKYWMDVSFLPKDSSGRG